MFLQIQKHYSSDVVNMASMYLLVCKLQQGHNTTLRNNYMRVRIIWALSFWWTSDLSGSLWGEYIPFWVTPAKPSTSKPVHLPLVHLPDSTFLTHHLPGGKRSHNRSSLQMKDFLPRGLGIKLPGCRGYGSINLKPLFLCHLVSDDTLALNFIHISVY